MNRKKEENGNPEEWKFSKVRVLVVDEGSLVSVQILHSIFSMLTKHAELQKFIFLGKSKLHVYQISIMEINSCILFILFCVCRRCETVAQHRAWKHTV